MKNTLKNIFMPLLVAAFGAFLPTDSAHAVGAVYTVPATIIIGTSRYSGDPGTPTTLMVTVTSDRMRDAVGGYADDNAATEAAMDACRAFATDPTNHTYGDYLMTLFNHSSITGTVDCEGANIELIPDGEFVGLDFGISVNLPAQGESETDGEFRVVQGGIVDSAIVALQGARNACQNRYGIHALPIGEINSGPFMNGLIPQTDNYVRGCAGSREGPDGVAVVAGSVTGPVNTPAPVVVSISVMIVDGEEVTTTITLTGSGAGTTRTVEETDNGERLGFAIGGAAIALGVAYYVSDGFALGEFNFSPDVGYSISENGYSANAGGQMHFRKDEWSFYWSAGQKHSDGDFGDFRYKSGGAYSTDFWKAAFSESLSGKNADYNIFLSANLHDGVWKVSPVYRMHTHFSDDVSETRNSLDLRGELRYNDWHIAPSAGFQWDRVADFGDSVRVRLQAVRNF